MHYALNILCFEGLCTTQPLMDVSLGYNILDYSYKDILYISQLPQSVLCVLRRIRHDILRVTEIYFSSHPAVFQLQGFSQKDILLDIATVCRHPLPVNTVHKVSVYCPLSLPRGVSRFRKTMQKKEPKTFDELAWPDITTYIGLGFESAFNPVGHCIAWI